MELLYWHKNFPLLARMDIEFAVLAHQGGEYIEGATTDTVRRPLVSAPSGIHHQRAGKVKL